MKITIVRKKMKDQQFNFDLEFISWFQRLISVWLNQWNLNFIIQSESRWKLKSFPNKMHELKFFYENNLLSLFDIIKLINTNYD